MAAAAGLVSVGSHGGVPLGSFTSGSAVVAAPLTAYGTIWTSDSGITMAEANCYTKWAITPIIMSPGTVTSFGISIYGTVDSNAWKQWQAFQIQNNSATNLVTPTIMPAANWFLLDAPAANTGTGNVVNPLTAFGQSLQFSGPLTALRVCLTTAFVGTATIGVSALAIP